MGEEAVDKEAAASLILEAIERMGFVLVSLAQGAGERSGDDSALIARIEAAAASSPGAWRAVCDGGPLLETPVDQASTPPERRIDDIRVPLKSIERIDSLVTDLVATQNRLLSVAAAEAVEPLREPLRRLAAIAGELRSEALAARLQPIGRLFANQQRLAHDVAKDLGRQVEVSFEGGDALLDRQLFGAVREGLAELIRDAIDNDIEPPEDRRRLGKTVAGRITVSTRAEADRAIIEVRNDGRGAERPDWSGRPDRAKGGVASLRAAVEDVGGSVAREARPGQGATTTLSIPLAVAAVSALIVEAGADRFAAPRRVVDDLVTLEFDRRRPPRGRRWRIVPAGERRPHPGDTTERPHAKPRPARDAWSFAGRPCNAGRTPAIRDRRRRHHGRAGPDVQGFAWADKSHDALFRRRHTAGWVPGAGAQRERAC